MVRSYLPLNALRAFEASARHLSFTRAAIELHVTQAAVSHQVKSLEDHLGTKLFLRLPRGLSLTDEGRSLLPSVTESFDRMANVLERFDGDHPQEVLNVGAVSTFAVGWLMPRLPELREVHPFIDLRLSTNNNRVDMAAEGLDYSIRFGEGAWHGLNADRLFEAPLSPLCSPRIAARLRAPADLFQEVLLRSYRADEWPSWFADAGLDAPTLKGPVFDSSLAMIEAALQDAGVAIGPPLMFDRHLKAGTIVQPFTTTIVKGSYWLTSPQSRVPKQAMKVFRDWILMNSY